MDLSIFGSIFGDNVITEKESPSCDLLIKALRAKENGDGFASQYFEDAGFSFIKIGMAEAGNHLLKIAHSMDGIKVAETGTVNFSPPYSKFMKLLKGWDERGAPLEDLQDGL